MQRDGRILDLIDDAWREDKLPYEDVAIPLVGEWLFINVSSDPSVYHSPFQETARRALLVVPLMCTKGSRDGSDSLPPCPVCPSFLCACEDVDVSLPLPLKSCRISSELECSSQHRVLGLAARRSSIVFSLSIPFMLLVFVVVSQLVCRAQRISLVWTVAVLVTLYFRFLQFC